VQRGCYKCHNTIDRLKVSDNGRITDAIHTEIDIKLGERYEGFIGTCISYYTLNAVGLGMEALTFYDG